MIDPDLFNFINVNGRIFGVCAAAAQSIVACCAFYSARCLVMRKITRATIFSSILGVTLFCGLLVFSVSEPERLRLASNNFKVIAHPSIGTEKLPRDRKTASESSDGGLSVARNSYVSEGKIIDHIGSEGRMIRFSPAERDVVARDYYIKIEAWFDLLLAMVKDFRTDLIVSFCLAIVLGFSVGNYERRRA